MSRNRFPDSDAVIKAIQTRYESGLALSPGQMTQGYLADPVLYRTGISLFGSWREVIEQSGLHYNKILGEARSRYPSGESVIKAILQRKENGAPLNAGSVLSKRNTKYADPRLHNSAVRYFGGWKQALEAAGIDPAKSRRVPKKYPDGNSVIAEIQRRHGEGLPNNAGVVASASDPFRDFSLWQYGTKYFGSWNEALKAAELSFEEVHPEPIRQYPDKQAVVDQILLRKQNGLPLNAAALQKGKKKEERDTSLLDRAKEYFGDWRSAIEAAGLDYFEIDKNMERAVRYPDKNSVIAQIQARHNARLPLTKNTLSKGRDKNGDSALYQMALSYFGTWRNALIAAELPELTRLINNGERKYPDKKSVIKQLRVEAHKNTRASGFSLKAKEVSSCLYNSAIWEFGSWRAALDATGVEFSNLRRNGKELYSDKDAVILAIQERHKAGLPLRHSKLIKKEGNSSLLRRGILLFGTWDAALKAAEVEPESKSSRWETQKKNSDS